MKLFEWPICKNRLNNEYKLPKNSFLFEEVNISKKEIDEVNKNIYNRKKGLEETQESIDRLIECTNFTEYFIEETKYNVKWSINCSDLTYDKVYIINNYVKKYSNIFSSFIEKYPNFLNIYKDNMVVFWKNELYIKYIQKYINDFLDILYENTNISTKHEIIKSTYWTIDFREVLIRVELIDNKNNNKFNHIDFLDIHNILWKSLNVFYKLVDQVFYEISVWNLTWKFSINAEVSDIEDEKFIKILLKLVDKYNIDLSKQEIIIEILENQKIPKTLFFKWKIEELKKIWFWIALDDILGVDIIISSNTEDIIFLNDYLDIIKIDWEAVLLLYKYYSESLDKSIEKDDLKEGKLNSVKKLIWYLKWKDMKVVAEWIENKEVLNFVTKELWISLYQWYINEK